MTLSSPHLKEAQLPDAYTEVSLLAQGARSLVYAATDGRSRRVAVKVLKADQARSPEAIRQFYRGAVNLARLEHPAFPEFFEQGQTTDGLPFYTMALVAGPALDAELPMPANCVRACLGDLAEALAYLHGRGSALAALRPDNILVTPDARLHVLDVQSLVALGEARGDYPGPLAFMAPEWLAPGTAHAASDLYALAACGYVLWSGKPPFGGAATEVLKAHLLELPRRVVSRFGAPDPQLASLLEALLAKDPLQRPDLVTVLRELGRPVSATPHAVDRHEQAALACIDREDIRASWLSALAAPGGVHELTILGSGQADKSAWMAALKLEAHRAGRPCLSVRCRVGDAPGTAARSIVRQSLAAAQSAPDELLAAWLNGEMPDTLFALPPYERHLAVASEVALRLDVCLERLGPIALVITDWHLADRETRELLRAVMAGAGRSLAIARSSDGRDEPRAGLTFMLQAVVTPCEMPTREPALIASAATAHDAEEAFIAAVLEATRLREQSPAAQEAQEAAARARQGALTAEHVRQGGHDAKALESAAEWTSCSHRVSAHHARQTSARAALALGRHDEALAHARVALGISQDWGVHWHIATNQVLVARIQERRGNLRAACDLAAGLLQNGTAPGNPFAQAGAALLLSRNACAAPALSLDPILAALRSALAGCDDPVALLAAHDLQELADGYRAGCK